MCEVNSCETMSAVLSARCESLDKIHTNNSLENLKLILIKQVYFTKYLKYIDLIVSFQPSFNYNLVVFK